MEMMVPLLGYDNEEVEGWVIYTLSRIIQNQHDSNHPVGFLQEHEGNKLISTKRETHIPFG